MSQTFIVNTIDPSRTLTIRNKFVADFRRRFKILRNLIIETVVTNDAFGLTKKTSPLSITLAAAPRGAFNFATNSKKIDGFLGWLEDQNNTYLLSKGQRGLQVTTGELQIGSGNQSWMNVYIDSAYRQGIIRGYQESGKILRNGQVGNAADYVTGAFTTPVHADRVGMIYTRAYSELKGITAAMETNMSSVLAMGMAEGRGPRQIAKTLLKTLDGTGESLGITDKLGRFIPSKRRAEILARTEVMRAHHSANIAEYRLAQIQGIKILAEHLTAGDSRVCPTCAPMEGKKYTLDEAENIIPVHPQCRCVAIPWIPEDASESPKAGDTISIEDLRITIDPKTYEIVIPKIPGITMILPDELKAAGDRSKIWFANIINTATEDQKKLIKKLRKPAQIVEATEDSGSFYNRGAELITSEFDNHTFKHEYGHHMDYVMKKTQKKGSYDFWSSKNKTFNNAIDADAKALGLDFSKFREGSKAGRAAITKSLATIAIREFMDETQWNAERAIHDIIDAMSRGYHRDIMFLPGHGVQYYSDPDNKPVETFANLTAGRSNKTIWAKMQRLFPKTTSAYDAAINKALKSPTGKID